MHNHKKQMNIDENRLGKVQEILYQPKHRERAPEESNNWGCKYQKPQKQKKLCKEGQLHNDKSGHPKWTVTTCSRRFRII